MMLSSMKKEKKRKRMDRDDKVDDGACGNHVEADVNSEVKRRKDDTTEPADCDTWSSEEVYQLLDFLEEQLNESQRDVVFKDYKKCWQFEGLQIGDHSVDDIRQKFNLLLSQVRKERSIGEVLVAAKVMHSLGQFTNVAPVDRPKKPLTMYFRFVHKRRRKYRKEHPDWNKKEINHQTSEDFLRLSSRKREKLNAEYDLEMEEYQRVLDTFKKDSNSTRPVLTAPFLLFVEHKKKNEKKDTSQTDDEVASYKERWKNLKDKKKLKYLNMAVEAKRKYDKDLAEYLMGNPDKKLPCMRVGFLTKSEWEVKDRLDGRPAVPALFGYKLYQSENASNSQKKPWSELENSVRAGYNKRCTEENEAYEEKLSIYLAGLTEEDRKMDEARHKHDKKKTPSSTSVNKVEVTKADGLQLYTTEMREIYQKKQLDLSVEAIYRLMAKDYYALSDIQQEGYTNRARGVKSRMRKTVKEVFEGAPQPPPRSAYGVFAETLKDTNKGPLNFLVYCAEAWSKADKSWYHEKFEKIQKRHRKAVKKFLQTLSKEDAERYLRTYPLKNMEHNSENKHTANGGKALDSGVNSLDYSSLNVDVMSSHHNKLKLSKKRSNLTQSGMPHTSDKISNTQDNDESSFLDSHSPKTRITSTRKRVSSESSSDELRKSKGKSKHMKSVFSSTTNELKPKKKKLKLSESSEPKSKRNQSPKEIKDLSDFKYGKTEMLKPKQAKATLVKHNILSPNSSDPSSDSSDDETVEKTVTLKSTVQSPKKERETPKSKAQPRKAVPSSSSSDSSDDETVKKTVTLKSTVQSSKKERETLKSKAQPRIDVPSSSSSDSSDDETVEKTVTLKSTVQPPKKERETPKSKAQPRKAVPSSTSSESSDSSSDDALQQAVEPNSTGRSLKASATKSAVEPPHKLASSNCSDTSADSEEENPKLWLPIRKLAVVKDKKPESSSSESDSSSDESIKNTIKPTVQLAHKKPKQNPETSDSDSSDSD